MRYSVLCCLTAFAAMAHGADAVRDWENLQVNSRHRLPARTYTVPLEGIKAALTDDLEFASPWTMSLDGVWRFSWSGDPARRPVGFEQPGFDDSRWGMIDVPSCVELRGYGSPIYTNVRYPHRNEWPKILDRDNGRGDYNPVSCYRRDFELPASWRSRRTILRFEGVGSAFYVWVNGKLAGYAEDSKLPSEFDITGALVEGRNQLAVEVYKWCDGSYLEDQDMFRYSGIFRNVSLWSMPEGGIWDFRVETGFSADGRDGTLRTTGFDGEVALYDGDRRIAVGKTGETLTVKSVRRWSAESPALYTLVLSKDGDLRAKRIGFKEQRVDGNRVLVNGRSVKFRGVNRHETSPDNGRTVTLDEMIADIVLMKKSNVDTVRTCHYPDHRLWYDLCDRYGLYVVAEANVEGHEPGYGDQGLGRFKEWEHSIVERNERQVLFYRNHPSIVFWSMGNETGHGDCFRRAIAAVKAIDPGRIIHWERGNEDADIDSVMYPSVEWLVERGKAGESGGSAKDGESGGEGFESSRQSAGKPLLMCEYAHAMGNALGNFQEYWDAIYAYPALIGGCIWDWVDQAIWKYTDRVDPATGERERYLAYGGDFDDEPNDGPFCVNGVTDPFRNITPKLIEMRHVYRCLTVRPVAGGATDEFELVNRFAFTRANVFDGAWTLIADGESVAEGRFEPPPVEPQSVARFTPDGLADAVKNAPPGAELFVNFAFTLREPARWAPRGYPVASDQLPLANPAAKPAATSGACDRDVPLFESTPSQLIVDQRQTTAIFNRRSGTLSRLVMRGVTVIDDPAEGIPGGPQLTCMRAATDNDRWMADGNAWGIDRTRSYRASGLTQLQYHAEPLIVTGRTVRAVVDVTGTKGCGFHHRCDYIFNDDGSVTLDNEVVPYGTMPIALPRLGLTLRLPARLENLRYYGRGPAENYIDRCTGSFIGVYRSTVTGEYVPYVRPQDCGGKTDVRWIEFTARDGRGVRFSSPEPCFAQALHFGWEDLEFSRHVNGQRRFRAELRPRSETIVNLDVRQTGLGGASCGPEPMAKYRFDPSAPVRWQITIAPVLPARR